MSGLCDVSKHIYIQVAYYNNLERYFNLPDFAYGLPGLDYFPGRTGNLNACAWLASVQH